MKTYCTLHQRLVLAIFMCINFSLRAQPANTPTENIPTIVTPPGNSGPYPGLYNMTFGDRQNYIRSITPDQPVTQVNASIKHRQITEYFDGLGRSLQTVVKRGHADGNDIVQPYLYDGVGRQSTSYLPYARPAHQSIGEFDHLPKARTEDFYPLSQGQQPYSKTEYDNSPLNRPLKQLAPGKSWVGSGRGIVLQASFNIDPVYFSGGIIPTYYEVKGAYPRFEFNTTNNTVSYIGTYPAGTLFVSKVTDEDGEVKEEVKDKNGRVLFTRMLTRSQHPPLFPIMSPIDFFPTNYVYTFYIYDDLDRLRVVVPPGLITPTFTMSSSVNNNITTNTYNYIWSAPTSDMLNGLCYLNNYNGRGSIIEKKIPGKAIENFVYDQRERLVLYQDGNLRSVGKWQYNFYDGFNRLRTSGLINLSDNRIDLQAQALSNLGNIPSGSWRNVVNNYNPATILELYPPYITGAEILTFNFYDNYDLVPTWYDATKIPAAPSGDATIVPSNYSSATKGMLTATKFKILDPNNPSVKWITTLYYYDDKGRLIQNVTDNINGGKEYNSQLFYFQGMPFQSVTHHHNPVALAIPGANDALKHIKLDKKYRRNLGQGGNDQVWQLQQTINDGTPYNLAYYDYDHMGRVVVKQYTMANVLQEYNIRGWLSQIHARNPMYTDSTYFRENLYYDDGFASKLYNGNIAGITWNNYGVIAPDNTKRNAYGYSYDKLGRLTHAEFRNNPSLPGAWVKDNKDYSASNITYDDRGNILTMSQRGMKVGPIDIDRLSYQYTPNTNQLKKVTDQVNPLATVQTPDFKDNANLPVEYTYDDNGNLLSDANKAITSITYNHLDKPSVITVQGKGSITYVYDAMGNRLRKTIIDNVAQTTEVWDYMGSFVYKNNVLQYILNEEGRSRPEVVAGGNQSGSTKFVYDYFIKDHLGNVRTTLAAEPKSYEYYAMHEFATANSEQLIFDNIAAVRDDKPGSINMDDLKAARLNAAEADRRIGTAIMLRVMPGDKFTLATDAYYEADIDGQEHDYSPAEDIVSSLLATLSGGTVGGKPIGETDNKEIIHHLFARPETLSGLENILNDAGYTGTEPRAGLNYLFFDEQMNLQPISGSLSLGGLSPDVFGNISVATGPAIEPGYLLVYVDNRSIGKDVWFDNVQVLHFDTKVVEENHYYPFGLTTSVNAMGATAQPLKYQSKELEKSFGIEMYDFSARMQDPQLGRTWQPDPMSVMRTWTSPYSWVQNNPVSRIDPSGAIDYEFDQFGNQISDLGGDKIDFLHQRDGSTKIVDRETLASNLIKGGEEMIRATTQRPKNTDWRTLYWEWEHGTGPARSLLSDFDNSAIGVFGSFDRVSSNYARKARAAVLSEGLSKNGVSFAYDEVNPISAGTDGWEQFIGRANLSYYKLGDKVLFMMNDSKSMNSFAYRAWPFDNHDRLDNFWGPRGSNTYQTYIWIETMSEIKSKNTIMQSYIQRVISAGDEYKSNPRYLPTLKD